jgi:hypothetical protein
VPVLHTNLFSPPFTSGLFIWHIGTWKRALCPIAAHWGVSRKSLEELTRSAEFWGHGDLEMRRRLSIGVKAERRFGCLTLSGGRGCGWMWQGDINAHMQSGNLRINPPIKPSIINGPWVWQTFTLGDRGLDVLSVTGEWMTGAGGKEVTQTPQCSGEGGDFEPAKPMLERSNVWMGPCKQPQRDFSLILFK